ncbi:MAG: hypothetical protein IKX56_06615 [Muribaculaceae bacterium]|nr:hypothetical protein [Muribaculaceae bacterium]
MKKTVHHIIMAAVILVTTIGGSVSHAAAAVPEGYKTFELTGFYVSLPDEFNKSEGWSTETTMSFNSDAVHEWEDGDEYSSFATVNVYDVDGTIENIGEYAENMKWSVKAMDETCDDPIVNGNTVLLRSTSEVGDGYLINWRFLVINENGKTAGGTISYRGEEAKYYDNIVTPIIQSIQFK